jgi:hypothetical protein
MAVSLENIANGKIYACRSSLLAKFVSGSVGEEIFSVSINLKVWNGDLTTDKPSQFTYQLQVPSSSMPSGLFSYEIDISDFVSEYVDMDGFDGTYTDDHAAFVELDWQVLTDDGSGTPSYDGSVTFAAVNGWASYAGDSEMPPYFIPSDVYAEGGSTTPLTILQRTVVGGSAQISDVFLEYSDGTNDSISVSTTGTRTRDIFQVADIDLGSDQRNVLVRLGLQQDIIKQFKIISKCKPRYTTHRIGYQNRIGVIDYLTCYGTNEQTQNVNREIYRKTVVSGNTRADSQYKVFHANGREDFTVNTDFIEQEANPRIQDILLSEYVFIDDTEHSIIIPSDNAQELKQRENDLINYTLSFKRGYDTIKSLK